MGFIILSVERDIYTFTLFPIFHIQDAHSRYRTYREHSAHTLTQAN